MLFECPHLFINSSSAARSHELDRWFTREVLPHAGALKGFLRSNYPVIEDVDDLVQETYVKLLRLHASRGVRHPRTLLFRAARSLAIDLIRRRRRSPFVEISREQACDVCAEVPGIPEKAARAQEQQILVEAIATLPPRYREALHLQRLERLPIAEAAARMGVTDRTLEHLVARALRRCAGYLRERGLPVERGE